MSELVFFDRDSDFRKVIKDQGDKICREQIYQETIDDSLRKFTVGFARVIEKAQIGQSRRKKSDKIQITSFCLLAEYPSPAFSEIFLLLLCGMENKHGEELLKQSIEYAKENKYNRLSLFSLNEEKLLNWYSSHGFKITETVLDGIKVKAFKLSMNFCKFTKIEL
jgi:hypothetical protein